MTTAPVQFREIVYFVASYPPARGTQDYIYEVLDSTQKLSPSTWVIPNTHTLDRTRAIRIKKSLEEGKWFKRRKYEQALEQEEFENYQARLQRVARRIATFTWALYEGMYR